MWKWTETDWNGGWAHRKRSKKYLPTVPTVVTAQPSPAQAAPTPTPARPGWLSGPCPDLPVVSLPPQPVAVPAVLDLEAAVARAVSLLQRTEMLGIET